MVGELQRGACRDRPPWRSAQQEWRRTHFRLSRWRERCLDLLTKDVGLEPVVAVQPKPVGPNGHFVAELIEPAGAFSEPAACFLFISKIAGRCNPRRFRL